MMKKKLTLLCGIFTVSLLVCSGLFAQQMNIVQSSKQLSLDKAYSRSFDGARSISCGPDTVLYTYAKATAVTSYGLPASGVSAFGQYYDAPQSITVSGLSFYAWVDSSTSQTVTLTCNLYNAGIDSLLTGTPLATGTVTIDSTFSPGTLTSLFKHVTFTSPVTVTAPYVITVESTSGINVGFVTNSSAAGNGQGENLSSAKYALNATWYHGYDFSLDLDALLYPHVSYSVTSGFTMSSTATTGNSTIAFTNTSSAIVNNRMYNYAVFNTLPNFTWNYGDGTSNDTLQESHTYVNNGCFDVNLVAKMYPWGYSTCFDSSMQSTVGNAPVAGYTFTNNLLAVTFNSGTTTGSPTIYSWDFGDGSPLDNTANPTHTYAANGTYTVTLTVTNGCGTDVSTQTVNLTTVSLDENSKAGTFAIYPNPSNGLFTIAIANNHSNINQLEVMNLAGELVYSQTFSNNSSAFTENLNLSELAKGVYSVRITSDNTTIVKKLTIQ